MQGGGASRLWRLLQGYRVQGSLGVVLTPLRWRRQGWRGRLARMIDARPFRMAIMCCLLVSNTMMMPCICAHARTCDHTEGGTYTRCGLYIYTSHRCLIVSNTLMMMLERHPMPSHERDLLEIANLIFFGAYTTELVLKLTALGFGRWYLLHFLPPTSYLLYLAIPPTSYLLLPNGSLPSDSAAGTSCTSYLLPPTSYTS